MSVVHLPVGPAQSNNPFRFFWDLGWQGVIPLLPVAATPDPSWAAKRGDAIAYGKMPAIKQPNGTWLPFSGWGTRETSESDLDRWNAWGANVGFRLPKDWLVFDIDILEKKWADVAEAIVTEHLGEAPCRVGQAPKRMLFYRLTEPSKGGWVYGETENGTERIEIFTHGRNTVLAGTHPKTNAPFQWPRAPIPADKLPRVTPDQLEAVWQALVDALPEGSRTAAGSAADRETISQRALAGDLETVTRAVQSMPNNRDIYPERDAYIKIGAAIKAALPDDEHEAFDLWCEWAAKDNGGTPELWEKDWRGLGDTFAVGAAWLYSEAERVSGGTFTAAQAHFEPVNDISEPSPFDIQAQHEREEPEPILIRATPYGFPNPATIEPRRWVYGKHYIRKFVSATVAPSGVGKSSLTIAEAVAMTSGKPILSQPVHDGPHRVWLWNGEDPRDELDRRISATMLHYGLVPEDFADRLYVDSGRDTEIVIAAETRNGVVIAAPVVEAIKRTIRENKLDVLVIDPFVSSHRVSENDNGAIDRVTKQWAAIADACNCAIELVHHVRKTNGNEVSVEDSRGAVALLATSRSARAITKMTPKEAEGFGLEAGAHRRFWRFSDAKNNLALPAEAGDDWMRMESVPLGNGPGEGLDRVLNGDNVGVVTHHGEIAALDALGVLESVAIGGGEADREGAALGTLVAAVADASEAGTNRVSHRSGDAWVGRAIARVTGDDLETREGRAKVKRVIEALLKTGRVSEVRRMDAYRKERVFLDVNEAFEADIPSQNGAFG